MVGFQNPADRADMTWVIENLALYLTDDRVEWKAAFPGSTSNGGFMKKATQVQWPTDDGPVQIKLHQGVELKTHVRGITGLVETTTQSPDLRNEALAFVSKVRLGMDIDLPEGATEDGEVFRRLKNVAAAHGGAVLVNNNLLRNGQYIAGERAGDITPLVAEKSEADPATEAEAQIEADSPTGQNAEATPEVEASTEASSRRTLTCAYLTERGFTCADWLPAGPASEYLRPSHEIAARLGAISLAYLWCAAPADFFSDDELERAALAPDLLAGHTPTTRSILKMDRQHAQDSMSQTIGWTLENMWGLAWVLGYDVDLTIDGGIIDEHTTRGLVEWMPVKGRTMTSILEQANARSAEEVADREDIFYCAHNAVHRAQHGDPSSVPDGFDPVLDGRPIAERRHSLTWSLSPRVEWDATDLST